MGLIKLYSKLVSFFFPHKSFSHRLLSKSLMMLIRQCSPLKIGGIWDHAAHVIIQSQAKQAKAYEVELQHVACVLSLMLLFTRDFIKQEGKEGCIQASCPKSLGNI